MEQRPDAPTTVPVPEPVLRRLRRPRLPRIRPRTYAWIATAALASLVVIVISGAAVRLSGSGLGCPDWPDCQGKIIQTELDTHGLIEYGNRLFTGVVSVCCILAALCAFLRAPFRRDLAILGALMPLGVVAQAVLGGFTVLYDLKPGFVMGHFLLSMLILAGAVTLAWRAWMDDDRARAREPHQPRAVTLATRALVGLGAWVLFLGTVATASGPHPGSSGTGEVVSRLDLTGDGGGLLFAIHWHGRFSTFLGLCAVATWFLARRAGAPLRWLTVVCLLMATQGVVGFAQYELELPAELVWVHVVAATATWLALLAAANAAGALPQRRRSSDSTRDQGPRPRERDRPQVRRELIDV